MSDFSPIRTERQANLLALMLAFCSFTYQLVIANTVVLLHGGQIVWYCATIGIYLSAMGVGTVLAGRLKGDRPFESLGRAEVLLSLCGGLSVALVFGAHILYRVGFFNMAIAADNAGVPLTESFFTLWPYLTYVGACLALIILTGGLTGFEMPLLIRGAKASNANGILGFNYLGALLGTLVYAFWLFPHLEMPLIAGGVALFNLALCWRLLPKKGSILAAAAVIVLAMAASPRLTDLQMRVYYYFQSGLIDDPVPLWRVPQAMAKEPPVERYRSAYQYVDIARPRWPNAPHVTTLYLNGHFQFSSRMERYYHEGMAHVPIARMGKVPKRVLILGAGDGLLIRELLEYGDRIEQILLVELDPAMVELARTHPEIRGLNEGALDNPKVKVLYEDAFYHLRAEPDAYDAIFIDFPYPYNYDLAKLFTVEFYTFVKRNLAPGGFAVINGPLYSGAAAKDITEKQLMINSIFFSTLDKAGFQTVAGFRALYESFLLAVPEKVELGSPDANPAGITYVALSPVILKDIKNQQFPHELKPELVNSVFKPTMTRLADPFL